MKPKERRLAAIMFTDIVGYSSIMQKDEFTASRLRARHREVFNRTTLEHDGRILQYFGDGTLSIFPSAAAAVECAVALQTALRKEPKVPIRIGIHTGDITFNEEEAYGDGVNVAARIESLCIPGSVFISGKVYDDIKNHPWLKAKSLGYFKLKNILHQMEIYVITNKGVVVPEFEMETKPKAKVVQNKSYGQAPKRQRRKKKWVATLLAFFFGTFGAHRFYLEQRPIGILQVSLFIAFIFIIPGMARFIGVLGIIGFVDFLAFLSMSRETFDSRYNKDLIPVPIKKEKVEEQPLSETKSLVQKQYEQYLQRALQHYRDYRYDEAISVLIKAVEIKYDDAKAHFMLACCYSLNEDAQRAIAHLEVAMAFGLKKPNIVHTHKDLAYLRTQPIFDVFVKNNYRMPTKEDSLEKDILDLTDLPPSNLLDQLKALQDQLEAGLITEEEYQKQQRKLRGGRP